MTDTKMRTLDAIQLNRQKINFQSYPKPKKQFVCLRGKIQAEGLGALGWQNKSKLNLSEKCNFYPNLDLD